jgi:hypothetical protein
VRPYLALTQTEVAGLLNALGRGAGVIYPYDPRFLERVSDVNLIDALIDAEALEASRGLDRVYRELAYDDDGPSAPAPPPAPDACGLFRP